VKTKFHLNENIEWHCMQLEFNSIQIHWMEFEFNLTFFQIQLKRSGMQIGGEDIESMLVNMT
jgi:hypothetical protein